MGPTAADMEPRAPQTGAPIPDWPVRDEMGQVQSLKDACEGHHALILFIARPASPGAGQALTSLARVGHERPVEFLRIAVLPMETRGAEVIKLARKGVKMLVLLNEQTTFDEKKITWAVTDKAARITGSGQARPGEISRLVGQLKTGGADAGTGASDSPRSITAPVLIVPEVLEQSLCKRLIAHFDKSEHTPSGVLDLSGKTPQWRPDPAVKQRRDLQLEDPELIGAVERAIAARVLPQIRKAFNYVVTHHEPFKLVRYDTGSGYFRPHRDNETRDTQYRRFAMTINLNTGEYDGGGLEFPEFGDALYRPPLGGGIVFSCSLLHEATDITRGSRYAILVFFYNPGDGLTSPRA